MKRPAAVLFIALVLARPADAFPWKRVVFYTAVGVSSGLATKAGHDCRKKHGFEYCTARYGEFTGTEITRALWTASMIGASEWGRKQQFKGWYAPALATGSFNTWWAAHEWRINPPPETASKFLR